MRLNGKHNRIISCSQSRLVPHRSTIVWVINSTSISQTCRFSRQRRRRLWPSRRPGRRTFWERRRDPFHRTENHHLRMLNDKWLLKVCFIEQDSMPIEANRLFFALCSILLLFNKILGSERNLYRPMIGHPLVLTCIKNYSLKSSANKTLLERCGFRILDCE